MKLKTGDKSGGVAQSIGATDSNRKVASLMPTSGIRGVASLE